MKIKVWGLLLLGVMAFFSCDDPYDYVTAKEYQEREIKLLDTFLSTETEDGILRDSLKSASLEISPGVYDCVDSLDSSNLGWAIYWKERGEGDPIEYGDEIGVEYVELSIYNTSKDNDNPEIGVALYARNVGGEYRKATVGSFSSSSFSMPFYVGLEEAMLNAYYTSSGYVLFDELDQLTFRYGDRFTMLLPTVAKGGSYSSYSYISYLEVKIGYVKRAD